jgi:hypothetical protein
MNFSRLFDRFVLVISEAQRRKAPTFRLLALPRTLQTLVLKEHVFEICDFLGYHTACSDNTLPSFGTTYRSTIYFLFLDFMTL